MIVLEKDHQLVIFFLFFDILLLNIYNENVVYNEDNQKVNHLFVYTGPCYKAENLDGTTEQIPKP